MADMLPLRTLQQAITDKLKGDPWFNGIPVITEKLGDIATLVDISVGKLGSCVVVETPSANVLRANVPPINFDSVPIAITVWENVILNHSSTGTGKYALDTAQIVAFLIHQFIPLIDGQSWNIITAVTPTIVKSEDPDLNGYHVFFTTSVGFTYAPTGALSTETNEQLLTEAGATLITES